MRSPAGVGTSIWRRVAPQPLRRASRRIAARAASAGGAAGQRLEVAPDDGVHLDAERARGRGVVDADAAVVVDGHGRGLDVLQHGAGELLDDAPSLRLSKR